MPRQARQAGVEWRPATIATSIARMHLGVRVSFRDGSAIRSRFVVGADGARSRVAADLGLDRNRQWIAGLENVRPSEAAGEPRFDCWIDPALAPGYLTWFVDDGEEAHVGVGGDPQRFNAAQALRVFEERLRSDGRLRDGAPAECRGGLIPVNGVLRRIACTRGLLVGDAAGAVSPLTAGGLDACLRLSSHAAAAILDALKDPSAMHGYSGAAYRHRFASRLLMRRGFDLVSRWPAGIELGFALARSRAVTSIVRHVFFGRGSFPDVRHGAAVDAERGVGAP